MNAHGMRSTLHKCARENSNLLKSLNEHENLPGAFSPCTPCA